MSSFILVASSPYIENEKERVLALRFVMFGETSGTCLRLCIATFSKTS